MSAERSSATADAPRTWTPPNRSASEAREHERGARAYIGVFSAS